MRIIYTKNEISKFIEGVNVIIDIFADLGHPIHDFDDFPADFDKLVETLNNNPDIIENLRENSIDLHIGEDEIVIDIGEGTIIKYMDMMMEMAKKTSEFVKPRKFRLVAAFGAAEFIVRRAYKELHETVFEPMKDAFLELKKDLCSIAERFMKDSDDEESDDQEIKS